MQNETQSPNSDVKSGTALNTTLDVFDTISEAIPALLASLIRLGGACLGGYFVFEGVTLSPESAIHQILQFNMISGGLILIAAICVWGAVDSMAAKLKRK